MSKRKIIKKLKKENRDLRNKNIDLNKINQVIQDEVSFILNNYKKDFEYLQTKAKLAILNAINVKSKNN